MISYYLQVGFLAIIQGISEFIPVSSSAHLILISKLNEFSFASLEIDISLHLGSLIAILIYFKKDLIGILSNLKLLKLILLGSIPLIIFGYFLFYFGYIYLLRDIRIIAWATLIFGVLLYISDRNVEKNSIENNLNLKNIILIGLSQVLALIPGVSRSGIIITTCRFYKFKRVEAATISFFLSIPALAGSSILGLHKVSGNFEFNLLIVISMVFSVIFSYLTIKFLLIYLKKFSLNMFVYYRIILSIFLFFIAYS